MCADRTHPRGTDTRACLSGYLCWFLIFFLKLKLKAIERGLPPYVGFCRMSFSLSFYYAMKKTLHFKSGDPSRRAGLEAWGFMWPKPSNPKLLTLIRSPFTRKLQGRTWSHLLSCYPETCVNQSTFLVDRQDCRCTSEFRFCCKSQDRTWSHPYVRNNPFRKDLRHGETNR